jgi:hypothetical protein
MLREITIQLIIEVGDRSIRENIGFWAGCDVVSVTAKPL